MLASSIPSKIALPFASSGSKRTIPVPSQVSITPGAASYTDGFPPLTFTDPAAGGIPPFGVDFNGIFFGITAIQQWQSAGGVFIYDAAFSTSIGGYPKGAILESADSTTQWINLADNNTTDPDGGSPANWGKLSSYGAAAITGLTNANVTLTPAQYSKNILTLAGTLTGNINIIFPASQQKITVLNNTTGAFTVTCKTASGTGAIVAQSGIQEFYADGTNLVSLAGDVRYTQNSVQGSFRNLQASSTGTSNIITITADEIVLGDNAGSYQSLRSWSGTVNMGATVANALDTGASAASTWYYLYAISQPNGSKAFLASLSATTPTLPSSYTKWAGIGSFRTDATGNKYPLGFKQNGRLIEPKVLAGSNLTAQPILASGAAGNPTTPTYVTASVTSVIPPRAKVIKLIAAMSGLGQGQGFVVAPNSSFGPQGSSSNAAPMAFYSAAPSTSLSLSQSHLMILETTDVYYASIGAFALYAAGYEDNF
jgi:hypothetical protein